MPVASAGKNIVDSAQINAGVIATSDLADQAVDTTKLKDDDIRTGDIKDGEIVNADISASAAIADTKLATISTAGKVDGAAITNLANIPAGAGVIPAANVTADLIKEILPGNGVLTTATLSVGLGNEQPCVAFADNTTGYWSALVKVPNGATSISSIKVVYKNDDGGSSKNLWCSFLTSLYNYSHGGTVVLDTTGTDTAFATVGTNDRVGILTAPADAYDALTGISAGDLIGIAFKRNSQNANDTYNATLNVMAIIVTFA